MKEVVYVIIGDKKFELRKTKKANMVFEVVSGKFFQEFTGSYTDMMMMFYAYMKGANRNTFNYSFDEFCDMLDEHELDIEVFTDALKELENKNVKGQSQESGQEQQKPAKKKK
ncbi:MAG TPA: hypothetical protein VK179_19555 [Bacteroidales bacterium]|nr:hypothetical protein [Bacteroidales bacterium]